MWKAAFVILASGDNPESLGRVVSGLMGAYEMMESGREVKIIFDGAGTQAAAALSAPDHKYHELFKVTDEQRRPPAHLIWLRKWGQVSVYMVGRLVGEYKESSNSTRH